MKYILNLLFTILIFFFFNQDAFAQNYFDIDLTSSYHFNDQGVCEITEKFEIKNKLTEKYLPSFEYIISNSNVVNIKVSYDGNDVPFSVNYGENTTSIKINFNDKLLGKNNSRVFELSYNINNLANRIGNIWEIAIPDNKNISEYNSIKKSIYVPHSYGNEAYFTPKYIEVYKTDNENVYIFNKNSLENSRIMAGFGEYQVFNFNIKYKLINEKTFASYQYISIPPDTSYQRVFYKSIIPDATNIEVDNDGNWLAKFKIPSNTTVDVNISGNVQLFANPRTYLTPPIKNLYQNIKSTKYWQSDSDELKNISKQLPTAQDKYNFVIDALSYNYSLSEQERYGALKSLDENISVTCREYTDLLISLFRASGIPAREIIGYAYSDNQITKPLSFFKDILHSWVEYWDPVQKIWISIDPTWGDTSNTDYFNKFDLKHFAFTIHGENDTEPFPPGMNYKSSDKDIIINIGSIENNVEQPPRLSFKNNLFYLFNRNSTLSITNDNEYALYNKELRIVFDNNLVQEENIDILPPHSTYKKVISSRYSFFSSKTPNSVDVFINDKKFIFNGPKKLDIYSQLVILFIFTSVLIYLLLRKIKKHAI